jgi:hypothetical protein
MIRFTILEDFVDRLQNAKRYGRDKYRACCPVHGGSNPTALEINYDKNGEVWAYCHNCGANTFKIAQALGVKGDQEADPKPRYAKNRDLDVDKHLIDIVEAKGVDKCTIYDKMAYRKAKKAQENYNKKWEEWFND